MLDFSPRSDEPSLRLLILHDDAEGEFAYTSGAEQALKRGQQHRWIAVSVRNNWATVFRALEWNRRRTSRAVSNRLARGTKPSITYARQHAHRGRWGMTPNCAG